MVQSFIADSFTCQLLDYQILDRKLFLKGFKKFLHSDDLALQSLIFELKFTDDLITAIHGDLLRLSSDQIIAIPHYGRTLIALVTMNHAVETVLR